MVPTCPAQWQGTRRVPRPEGVEIFQAYGTLWYISMALVRPNLETRALKQETIDEMCTSHIDNLKKPIHVMVNGWDSFFDEPEEEGFVKLIDYDWDGPEFTILDGNHRYHAQLQTILRERQEKGHAIDPESLKHDRRAFLLAHIHTKKTSREAIRAFMAISNDGYASTVEPVGRLLAIQEQWKKGLDPEDLNLKIERHYSHPLHRWFIKPAKDLYNSNGANKMVNIMKGLSHPTICELEHIVPGTRWWSRWSQHQGLLWILEAYLDLAKVQWPIVKDSIPLYSGISIEKLRGNGFQPTKRSSESLEKLNKIIEKHRPTLSDIFRRWLSKLLGDENVLIDKGFYGEGKECFFIVPHDFEMKRQGDRDTYVLTVMEAMRIFVWKTLVLIKTTSMCSYNKQKTPKDLFKDELSMSHAQATKLQNHLFIRAHLFALSSKERGWAADHIPEERFYRSIGFYNTYEQDVKWEVVQPHLLNNFDVDEWKGTMDLLAELGQNISFYQTLLLAPRQVSQLSLHNRVRKENNQDEHENVEESQKRDHDDNRTTEDPETSPASRFPAFIVKGPHQLHKSLSINSTSPARSSRSSRSPRPEPYPTRSPRQNYSGSPRMAISGPDTPQIMSLVAPEYSSVNSEMPSTLLSIYPYLPHIAAEEYDEIMVESSQFVVTPQQLQQPPVIASYSTPTALEESVESLSLQNQPEKHKTAGTILPPPPSEVIHSTAICAPLLKRTGDLWKVMSDLDDDSPVIEEQSSELSEEENRENEHHPLAEDEESEEDEEMQPVPDTRTKNAVSRQAKKAPKGGPTRALRRHRDINKDMVINENYQESREKISEMADVFASLGKFLKLQEASNDPVTLVSTFEGLYMQTLETFQEILKRQDQELPRSSLKEFRNRILKYGRNAEQ